MPPMKVITDGREFVDDTAPDVDEMVAYLDKYKGKSRSSCPNVTDWPDAFGDADDIFCVTITSGLSGSYNSACAAKKLLVSALEREHLHKKEDIRAKSETIHTKNCAKISPKT